MLQSPGYAAEEKRDRLRTGDAYTGPEMASPAAWVAAAVVLSRKGQIDLGPLRTCLDLEALVAFQQRIRIVGVCTVVAASFHTRSFPEALRAPQS